MFIKSRLTVTGLTRGKIYKALSIKNSLVEVVLDDGTKAFRLLKAFDLVV